MRQWIDIVETVATIGGVNLDKVRALLIQSLRSSDGGWEQVKYAIRHRLGLPEFSSHEHPDPPNMDELINEWCDNAIEEVEFNLGRLVENGQVRCWREITAGRDWTPSQQHPGLFWSWDEHAAEAHWGDFKNGVKWLMEALVNVSDIDWYATLVMNANPDYSDEKEIRLKQGSHPNVVRYERA